MERRTFLRSGLALSAAGLGGGLSLLPEAVSASVRPADGTLRLNSNENPLGLAPAARRAVIDNIGEANRYPRESRVKLIEALAKKDGVAPDNIVLGCGSTEVLQMSVQCLAGPNAPLVLADPTFEDVPRYAQPYTYRLEKVPLGADYAHDLSRMRERAESAGGRALVYICNPNNPTGTVTPSADVDAWIESAADDVYFLVDEAYYEYCADPAYWSCLRWIADRPNVIVSRSFSKIYGMAGMRLGYGITHAETAERLRQFIGMNNANQLALAAALASLADEALVARSREANARGVAILLDTLDQLGLEYLPSQTNFVMHRINGELADYRRRMADANVSVGRPFPPMLEYNRLSIGTPEEMERFTEILRGFRDKGWI
jgi:histidinol-phosphate aminotransferase